MDQIRNDLSITCETLTGSLLIIKKKTTSVEAEKTIISHPIRIGSIHQ
jgi:hypothetical protein